jgi:predicted O-linked N-acetylglucosamine transferase (SPINDLY family)
VNYYVFSKDIPNDSVPVKFQSLVKFWLDTNDILDDKLAKIINSQNLDLLIDLTITDNGHRPGVIARHPVRKILRWFGPCSGVFAHGYDGVLSQPKKKNSNQIMPIVIDPATMPEVEGMSPFQELGFITFGGRCDLNKLNLAVVMVWGDILRGVPGSRLLLHTRADFSDEVRQRCIDMFTAAGVFDRIEFDKPNPAANNNLILERLGYMVEIDVYLDIFPSNGLVDLADALWAGVPVVTFVSDSGLDMAEAILTAGGQADYIALDQPQYVQHAIQAAKAVSEDKNWRADMHAQVSASALFNPEQWGQTFYKVLQSETRNKPAKKKTASKNKTDKS